MYERPAAESVAAGWKEAPAPGVERSVSMGSYTEVAHSELSEKLLTLMSVRRQLRLVPSMGVHLISQQLSLEGTRPADRQGGSFGKDSISYIKLYPTEEFLHKRCLMLRLCM